MARFRVERLELYYDRKENEECVQCGRDLAEDADTVFCEECAEEKRQRGRAYYATDGGKKAQRKYQGARRKLWREQNAAGEPVCIKCGGRVEASRAGKSTCDSCREINTRATAKWRRRVELKRQGIASIEEAREKREHKKPRKKQRPSLKYVPVDELLASTRYRLLSTIVRFDWFSATDLFDALGLPTFEISRTERDRFAKTLERFVKRGLIRYRDFRSSGSLTGKKPTGLRNGGTYKITEDGRAMLADLKQQIAKGIAC